jgi:hypothetical protein
MALRCLIDEPLDTSVRLMKSIDKLKPGMRALVHEFGAVIVGEMIGDGYHDAAALRPVLEQWRSKRQQEWLNTDYITHRPNMSRHILRALGDGKGR